MVLDVPDLEKSEDDLKKRKQTLGDKYSTSYSTLRHLYYDRSWFERIAGKYNCDIEITDQFMKNYENANVRYNVIIKK